jgi:hypothetical protein
MGFWDDYNVDEAVEANSAGGEYEPLPDAWYEAMCESAQTKTNDKGNTYIACVFVITSEDYKGRKLFVNYNVINGNPTAQQIGRAELGRFCKAAGIGNPTDDADLVDAVVMIKVGRDKKESDRNAIKAYKPVGSVDVQTEPKPTATKKSAAAESKKSAPWK